MSDYREQAIWDVAAALGIDASDLGTYMQPNKPTAQMAIYAVAQREKVLELEAELKLQKGANAAQDERERKAAERLSMVHTWDWPDEVAERVLELWAQLACIVKRFDDADEGTLHVRDGVAWAMAADARTALEAQLQQKEGERG